MVGRLYGSLERRGGSLPSRVLLFLLLAGGIHAAALTNGIDRVPRRARAGNCVSTSGCAQRFARGTRQGSDSAPDAIIGPDSTPARSIAARGGDTGPHAATVRADLAALPVLADAGAAPDRPAFALLCVSTAASGRGPPTA